MVARQLRAGEDAMILFISGLFVGAFLGVFAMAMCFMCKKEVTTQ
jgi:hypothetical protein